MGFKVEGKVPIPKIVLPRYSKYPFASMKLGDSFVVPLDMSAKARFAASTWARRNNAKFITRKTKEGLRIWRVAK